MAQSNDMTRVTVSIYGEEYIVKGDTEPDYIRKIASFVDSKMRELNRIYPRLTFQRLAILTAINLADEIERLKRENNELTNLMEELGEDD